MSVNNDNEPMSGANFPRRRSTDRPPALRGQDCSRSNLPQASAATSLEVANQRLSGIIVTLRDVGGRLQAVINRSNGAPADTCREEAGSAPAPTGTLPKLFGMFDTTDGIAQALHRMCDELEKLG